MAKAHRAKTVEEYVDLVKQALFEIEELRVAAEYDMEDMGTSLKFVDDLEADDQVFEDHGVKVIVDPKSLPYLDGTEVDYGKEGLNEGFKFNNPNVKNACGCGESFNV